MNLAITMHAHLCAVILQYGVHFSFAIFCLAYKERKKIQNECDCFVHCIHNRSHMVIDQPLLLNSGINFLYQKEITIDYYRCLSSLHRCLFVRLKCNHWKEEITRKSCEVHIHDEIAVCSTEITHKLNIIPLIPSTDELFVVHIIALHCITYFYSYM